MHGVAGCCWGFSGKPPQMTRATVLLALSCASLGSCWCAIPFPVLVVTVPNGSSFPKVVWPFSFLHCCHQWVSGPGRDVPHETVFSKRATQYTKPCCGAGDQDKPALSKTTTIFPDRTHEGNEGLAMWDEEGAPSTRESHALSFEPLCYDFQTCFLLGKLFSDWWNQSLWQPPSSPQQDGCANKGDPSSCNAGDYYDHFFLLLACLESSIFPWVISIILIYNNLMGWVVLCHLRRTKLVYLPKK